LLRQAHATELGIEFGIGKLTGSLPTTACGGDLRFIKADFRVLLEGFSDEVAAGDSRGVTRCEGKCAT
jgi:hypothetical protein